jgi:hypothetical protein
VLAVLAFACVPGFAQAEEATGPQYTPEVPTVPNNESSKPPTSGGSNDGGDKAEASESPDGAGTGEGNGSGSGGGGNTGQGSQGPQGNGANQDAGAGNADGKLADSKPLAKFEGVPSSVTDDGSSSPLVPILIAIAVLAAISGGAFYYRQRRHDADSPVSPKAS